jgi:hypothetical protein
MNSYLLNAIIVIGIVFFIKLLFNQNKNEKKVTTEPNKPIISDKNKWLYPTDEFGKMEKGTEYESKSYENKNR